jgi:hypothetical protein
VKGDINAKDILALEVLVHKSKTSLITVILITC